MSYRPRIADAELRACLDAAGAVVIEGLERLMVLENRPAWRGHGGAGNAGDAGIRMQKKPAI